MLSVANVEFGAVQKLESRMKKAVQKYANIIDLAKKCRKTDALLARLGFDTGESKP